MIRLFVGIALPLDIRERLTMVSAGLPGARWISPDNLHLTLRFIGEVDEHQVDDIDQSLAAIGGPAFRLRSSGIETFGRGHQMHTLWARIDPEPGLMALQGKIEQAMIRQGQPPEGRKFTPHITLARIRRAGETKVAQWLETYGGLTVGEISVGSFVLYRSHLGTGGAHYEVLSEYSLEPQ